MHPHTKQQLERFDKQFAIGQGRKWIMTEEEAEEVKAFIQQALKSQAEYIRAEMVQSIKDLGYEHNEARHGSTVGDVYLRVEEQGLKNLDELINSFK